MLCGAQYTEDRSKIYDYVEYSNGIELTTMYVSSKNNSVFYEDFEAFNGLKIGFLKESFQNTVFEGYAKQNNFSYEKVYYDFEEEMIADMESGNFKSTTVTYSKRGGLYKKKAGVKSGL